MQHGRWLGEETFRLKQHHGANYFSFFYILAFLVILPKAETSHLNSERQSDCSGLALKNIYFTGKLHTAKQETTETKTWKHMITFLITFFPTIEQ